MEIMFSVPGEPTGKGRPRMTKQGHTYTPQKTVEYENLVRQEYLRRYCDTKFEAGIPLDARIVAYYAIPKSASKKKRAMMLSGQIRPMKKPDGDNVVKSILDALNGVAYHDDAQVVDHMCRKFYAQYPRVTVKIIGMTEEE